MKHILLFLLLFVSGTAFAETGAQDELNQLEAELNGVRQEQQSVYQNYQMTKELRLTEVQESSQPYGASINTPPPNYDDVMREQLEREQRIQQYSDELKSLSERYLDLEEERKALLEQIRELKQQTQ
jgi:hypothetical protein